jgi:hypothetical protein
VALRVEPGETADKFKVSGPEERGDAADNNAEEDIDSDDDSSYFGANENVDY